MSFSGEIREYREDDLPALRRIWNEVVEAGNAFPQTDELDERSARQFFAGQSSVGVAVAGGEVCGLYILHPNNVGRCGHIANASYAVSSEAVGRGIGRALVFDSLKRCKALGFKGLQFNAVVDGNVRARRLYEDIGFTHVGIVPQGFHMKDGSFEDIHIYYHPTE